MESLSFAALTHHAGIKSAVVCVTIVDRLKGDQVGTFVITRPHYDSITIDYRPGYLLSNAYASINVQLNLRLGAHWQLLLLSFLVARMENTVL